MKYIVALPECTNNLIWECEELQPNPIIQKIYKSGEVILIDGTIKKISSAVSPGEGYILYDTIKVNKYKDVLEVGCAYGMSSLYMGQALQENKAGCLTSIDPFQMTQWSGIGVNNIKSAGLSRRHKLIQEPSYSAMPRLLSDGKRYDMIFIDGMHLFDYTLVDVFYATLLLRDGGCLIIDDILHAGVQKCIKYIDTNYPHLHRMRDIPSKTIALYTCHKDTRQWDFHRNF